MPSSEQSILCRHGVCSALWFSGWKFPRRCQVSFRICLQHFFSWHQYGSHQADTGVCQDCGWETQGTHHHPFILIITRFICPLTLIVFILADGYSITRVWTRLVTTTTTVVNSLVRWLPWITSKSIFFKLHLRYTYIKDHWTRVVKNNCALHPLSAISKHRMAGYLYPNCLYLALLFSIILFTFSVCHGNFLHQLYLELYQNCILVFQTKYI